MYQVIILTGAAGPGAKIPQLGPYKCANALRANGISCLVVGNMLHYSIDEINELLDHAVSEHTLMIGVSTTFLPMEQQMDKNDQHVEQTDSYRNSKSIVDKYRPYDTGFDAEVLYRLRNKFPNLKFIAGGANVAPERETAWLDFMCIGYSESSIVNVARHLLHGDAIPESRKNVFGTVIVNDPTAKLYDFQNEVMTWLPEDIVTHTKLPIEMGRGCIFNCKFCSYPMRGKDKLDYLKFTDCLRQELMHNYENYGITFYCITDDTFNDSKEKLIAVRDMVRTLPFQPNFWCYARLDLIAVNLETIDMLYEIGIRSMFFGIETLDRRSGLTIGKGFAKEKLISTVKIIKQKYPDVLLLGSFIIGTPYESVESVIETNRLLCSGEFPLDQWRYTPLKIWRPTTVNKTVWLSEFDLNWEKYGYTEVDNPPDQVKIFWKNQEMDYFKASELARDFGWQMHQLKNGEASKFLAPWIESESRDVFLPKFKKKLLDIVIEHNAKSQL